MGGGAAARRSSRRWRRRGQPSGGTEPALAAGVVQQGGVPPVRGVEGQARGAAGPRRLPALLAQVRAQGVAHRKRWCIAGAALVLRCLPACLPACGGEGWPSLTAKRASPARARTRQRRQPGGTRHHHAARMAGSVRDAHTRAGGGTRRWARGGCRRAHVTGPWQLDAEAASAARCIQCARADARRARRLRCRAPHRGSLPTRCSVTSRRFWKSSMKEAAEPRRQHKRQEPWRQTRQRRSMRSNTLGAPPEQLAMRIALARVSLAVNIGMHQVDRHPVCNTREQSSRSAGGGHAAAHAPWAQAPWLHPKP